MNSKTSSNTFRSDPTPMALWQVLLLVAVCGAYFSGRLASSEFIVRNPYAESLSGTFSIPVDSLGADAARVRLVRADSAVELPSQCQIIDGRNVIIGGLSLRGGEEITIRAELFASALQGVLRLHENEGRVLVAENSLYRLLFNGSSGYQLIGLEDIQGGTRCDIVGGFSLIEDGEPDAFNGLGAKARHAWLQREAQVLAKILYLGPCEGAVQLSWLHGGSSSSVIMRFNAFNRLVRCDATMKPGAAIMQASYSLSLPRFSSAKGEATMLPQNERMPLRAIACPGYQFIWNPERRQGVGLIASEGGNILNAYWEMKGLREGDLSDNNVLSLFGRPLRGAAVPAQPRMSFALMAGGDPREIATYCLAAGREREFSVSFKRASLALLDGVFVGRQQRLHLTLGQDSPGNRISITAGSQTLYAGAMPDDRRVECDWLPTDEGRVEILVKGETGELLADQVVMVRKEVNIRSLATAKIVFKPGETMTAKVVIGNNVKQGVSAVIRSSMTHGIDQRVKVDEQRLSLAAGEEKTIEVSWKCDISQGGVTMDVEALIDGRMIDFAEETFAVSDSNVRVGQYSVCNPGWFNRSGQEIVTAKKLRNNYFSAFEYYAWTPCPFTNLTPLEDSWDPQTESQVAYACRIDKSFVKGFVKHAHDNGIQVYPWMNGEVALPSGLDHPEHFRYSAQGQPLLKNGNIWEGKRYAIAYSASPYSEKEAYAWGQRMADSIDMFGWDGCRFDWAFTPWIVGDPMRAGQTQWYDSSGKGSYQKFEDNDAAGTAFLKSFRRGVAERYPRFVYGANCSDLKESTWKKQPNYSAELSRDSWLWFESLLEYNRKEIATWNVWAKRMTSQYGPSRLLGAQVGVGWMRMYPPGTVTHKLMPYAILFSGFKWIGPQDRQESLGENWKCWRYAMRFSEYFYGNDFSAVTDQRIGSDIIVLNDEGTLWKPWVFERTANNARDIMIGVLNTEGSAFIAERRPIPVPRRGIKIKVVVAADERLVSASLLASDPTPRAIRLEVDADGALVVPTIDWAGAVVIHIERK